VVANKKNTFGSVVIFKKFDEGCNDWEDSYNFTDFNKWVKVAKGWS
jgi:hypothetical protein